MWLSFALGSALFNAIYGLEQNRIAKLAHPIQLSFLVRIWSLPILGIALMLFPEPWHVHPSYWLYLVICSSLTVLGTYLTFIAYRLIDFSLAFPILNLTPALALGTAWLIDREVPTTLGIVGVVLVIVGSGWLGSTALNRSSSRKSQTISIRGLFAIVSVATLYSITSSYDKLGINNSSPLLWTLGLTIAMALLSFILIVALPNKVLLLQRSEKTPLWSIGILGGIVGSLSMIFQMFALHAGGARSIRLSNQAIKRNNRHSCECALSKRTVKPPKVLGRRHYNYWCHHCWFQQLISNQQERN